MCKFYILIVALPLVGCADILKGTQPVDDFKIDQYLGTWYEIARLDHILERDLDNVMAEYILRKEGVVLPADSSVRQGRTLVQGWCSS
ncbi:MAG: lipocalin family protein [Candidatus Thiodiazotropha sp. (ex. Lucinoma kazani)]